MTLELDYSFGFRNSIKNFVFYDNDVVLFAAGKICVLLDLNSQTQRQFEFAERTEVSALAKCGVLIAGALRGTPPSVCLLNTLSDTKKFYLAPSSLVSDEIICVSISTSLKLVAAQGNQPDWTLIIWLSQTKEVLATYNPAKDPDCSVRDISFNAANRDELVVIGSGVFKLYEYQEGNDESGEPPFDEHVFEQFEKTHRFYSACWPQKDNLAVSTSNGKIIFFRGIELVNEMFVADDVQNYPLDSDIKDVTSIVVTEQHLVCVFGGLAILVYFGEEIRHYKLAKVFLLPPERLGSKVPGENIEEADATVNVMVSPDEKDLVATTRNGQIMLCRRFAEGNQQYLTPLLKQQHIDSVIKMDVARGRPIFVTCSRHMIILWNYENKKQELRKMFKHEITDITVHPTGLYIALSFDYCFRVFSILYSDLNEQGYIASKNCHKIGFSSGGHLLAVVCNSVIKIYSFPSLVQLFMLDGHAGAVSSFDWNENDMILVSCDIRGVICEWNLASHDKNWEVTAVLTYLNVSMNPKTGNILAVSSDNSVRCFKKSSLMWKIQCQKEPTCAVFFLDGKAFLIGTNDGCLEFYSSHEQSESTVKYIHSGKVTGVKYNFGYNVVVSCGTDGSLFLWKISGRNGSSSGNIFSDLSLVNSTYWSELKNVWKQLWMSVQHADIASNCEFELSCVKHEKELRNMILEHEQNLDILNEKMACIKEEIQNFLFEFDPKEDIKELELVVKNEIIDSTFKLHEAYNKSNSYTNETNSIISKYERIIDSLSEKHAKFSYAEHNAIEEITRRIKCVEDSLILEKGITERTVFVNKECKEETKKKVYEEANSLKSSQITLLEQQQLQFLQLQHDFERLKQLTAFKAQDTKNRRNVTSGQIDYDIKEKANVITVLKKDFQRLESILELKEKATRKQEKKFSEMRKLVGNFQKRHSVSKTAIEELLEDIQFKESQIESHRKNIKEIENSILNLREEIKGIEDLCLMVTEKLGESVEGYQKKEKVLHETQEVISQYTSMLRICLTKECNPFKLVQDITGLFESSMTGFTQEVSDSGLLDEYESQINKLKCSYDLIKGEPSRALRIKSVAEFRLSQDNSKVLQKVHSVQNDAEKLRLVINEMETALGLYTVKSSKKADDLRDRIEFVMDASMEDKDKKAREISSLDAFIEEQQNEISRFQTMLAGKADNLT